MLSFLSNGTPNGENTPWWVKITTVSPHCLYYFGPFDSFEEARQEQGGYLEDLEEEGARGISLSIERADPHALTVFEDGSDPPISLFPHARTFSRFIS
ncbi:DUF1816 domain-containing protein [Pannus brasiliensis CCIBt3594]|uniref:DUF1816 domain-containing protein n=1 Tax=Pannus brasiliensis CCIBt3594 TaxID=1427578 RepID=A0AAW9QMS3_9CHRO